ncbi:MAG: hypothetical protein MUD01_03695 [Chloroflexaceae bacterium]|jgi:hypothetical protein|nr:hypothetical protein [Chloroflexaceae bacterium]
MQSSVNPLLIWAELLVVVGIYFWSIFALPNLLYKDAERFSLSTFRYRYPHTRVILIAHELLSWVVIFGSLIGGILIADLVFHSMHGAFALGFFGMLLWNGLFELITAISPKYGFIIRRWNSQTFMHGPHVRRLALVRIGIGIVGLAVLVALIQLPRLF